MKEHDIQAAIVSLLRISGFTTICTDMSIGSIFLGKQQKKRIAFFAYIKKQGYTNGSPDLIATKDGITLFIEVKTEKGRLSKDQKHMQEILPNYHVVRNITDIRELIKKATL